MLGLIGPYKLVHSEWQAPEIKVGEGTYGMCYADEGANYSFDVIDDLLRLTMRFREHQLTVGVERDDGSQVRRELDWPEDKNLGSGATQAYAFSASHFGSHPGRLIYDEDSRIEF